MLQIIEKTKNTKQTKKTLQYLDQRRHLQYQCFKWSPVLILRSMQHSKIEDELEVRLAFVKEGKANREKELGKESRIFFHPGGGLSQVNFKEECIWTLRVQKRVSLKPSVSLSLHLSSGVHIRHSQIAERLAENKQELARLTDVGEIFTGYILG